MQWSCCQGKPTTVLGSLWKHILETLIKLLWHYSYSVAFIHLLLVLSRRKAPQALTGISTLCTNSMEILTPNQPVTWVCYSQLLPTSKVSNVNGKCSRSTLPLLRNSFRSKSCQNTRLREDIPLVQVALKAIRKIYGHFTTTSSIYGKTDHLQRHKKDISTTNTAFQRLNLTLLVCLFKTWALQFATKL